MATTIHVRRQGRVCTVFLDEAERPMTIASAEDQPVGGFPLTFTGANSEGQIRARFPGCNLHFHDEVRAPQPEAPVIDAATLERQIAQIMGEAQSATPPKAQVTLQTHPQPAASGAQPSATEEALAAVLCNEFERLVRDAGTDAEALREVESVGTFLIGCFPLLEPLLAAAAARARAPKTRKRFSL